MKFGTFLMPMVGTILFSSSLAFATDELVDVEDRLIVVETQVDSLIELLVGESYLVKLCHVPPGNHDKSRVLLLTAPAVRSHLEHGGESLDYLLPGDTELRKGEWCDPYARVN